VTKRTRWRGTGSAACIVIALCLFHSFSHTAAAQPSVPFKKDVVGDLQVRANRDVKATTDKFYVLQATDKREIRDYITRAIKVEKAWPVDIAGYLQNMVNLEKGFVFYPNFHS